MIVAEFKLHIAAIGDFLGILQGLLVPGEQGRHFRLTLDIELLGLELHPAGIVHGFLHLDAHEHILHGRILFADIVGIVGDHHGKTGLPSNSPQTAVDPRLLLQPVILHLQIKMIGAEHTCHPLCRLQCALIVILHELLGNLAGQAGRKGNQALMILLQQLMIHPGLAVKAVQIRLGHHVAQVLIAGHILTQQHQMVIVVVDAVDPVSPASGGHIDLAANDRLNTRFLRRLIEVDDAVHCPVIGDGNGSLAQLLHPAHELFDPARAIQQAVFRMNM